MEAENGEDLIGVARVEICAELKVDAKEKNGKKQSENKFSFFFFLPKLFIALNVRVTHRRLQLSNVDNGYTGTTIAYTGTSIGYIGMAIGYIGPRIQG